MGRAARARFEQEFTRERMIDRTVAMYERVMTELVPAPSPLMKRAFDIALSGLGLILSAPVWALAAAAITLEDGGPVFFRQPRVGQNGTLFTVLKFRSMVVRDDARSRAASGLRRRCAHHPHRTVDARHGHGRAAAARQHLQRRHELRRSASADAG